MGSDQSENLEYLLRETLRIFKALDSIGASLDCEQSIAEIKRICGQEFKASKTDYIPPEEVRIYFKDRDQQVFDDLREKNYFPEGDNVFAPLKNNGNGNLGVLVLKGVVDRFLEQDHDSVKDPILEVLGAKCGYIVAKSKMTDKAIQDKDKARHEADYDHLTGLLTRRKLQKVYETLRQSEDEISMLMIDIDYFKQVNDTHGHSYGDSVLKWVGKIIRSEIRKTAYAARFGGDEFVVILPTNVDVASSVGDRIRERIQYMDPTAEPGKLQLTTDSDPGPVTCSVGVVSSKQIATGDDLFQCADQMMYQAKNNGRNQLALFSNLR